MAFRAVSGNFKYTKYSECEEGQILAEGVYLGKGKSQYGENYQIRLDDKSIQVLNSAGQLNYIMENHISKGDYIRVTYKGSTKLVKGPMKGKDAHNFEVEVDDQRSSASPVSPVSAEEDPEETTDLEETDEVEAEEDIEEEEVEEVPPPKKAKAAAKSPDDVLAKYRKGK